MPAVAWADCLKRGDLDGSFDMFRKCLSLTRRVETFLGWPVPEPRIRHDYEQLELLQQRGDSLKCGACPSCTEALLRPDRRCRESLLSGGNDAEASGRHWGRFTIGRTLLFGQALVKPTTTP